jgi:hypothetical protein
MARVFIDGFDHGSTGLWDVDSGVTLDGTSKVTGTYSVAGEAPLYYLQKTITATDEIYLAFRVYKSALEQNHRIVIYFYDGSDNLQANCTLDYSSGCVTFTVYNSTPSAEETYNYYFSIPNTYHVQIRFLNTDDDDKTMQVKVNNVEILDVSWTNSSPDSATTEKVRVSVEGTGCYFDDFVFDDSEWPGAPYVYTLQPDADGSTNEWTPSTGSDNYAVVDEIPASDADYVETDGEDDIDLYSLEHLPDTEDWAPNSVQVSARAMSPGTPANEYLALVVHVSGESNHESSSKFLSSSFGYVSNLWNSNPVSGEWTEYVINNMEAGIKCKAS